MRITALRSSIALAVVALALGGCGSSTGGTVQRTLADPAGDVAASAAPDIVGVTVRRDAHAFTFRVRFAAAPPLRLSTAAGWVDMLLIGIDVPPFGAPPTSPGGEWAGVDYALGMHGADERGMLVRSIRGAPSQGGSTKPSEIPVKRDGATLSMSVPRSALGNPAKLALSIAGAREWNDPASEPAGAQPDVAPDSGTWTVSFGG